MPQTKAVATAAMRELLAGPDEAEMAARPAMYTAIPDGTTLLGISIADGIATVNLSQEFESGGGSASMQARVAQVIYTLTQFPTVSSVRFQLDGVPVTALGGEGLVLDAPVGRADFRNQSAGDLRRPARLGREPRQPRHGQRRRERVRGDVPGRAARRGGRRRWARP